MSKAVTAMIGGFLTFIGLVVGVWPMNITVLGTTAGSYPAPWILLSLIVTGRPEPDQSALLGDWETRMWDSLFYEALIRTGVAGFLTITGIGMLATVTVYALMNPAPGPMQQRHHRYPPARW